ncbi:MAG: hypothetical protein DWQ35_16785 [Planctomycetota bacterium]|nr:MAG: hypothetical protein DWQ35_16785 [Planctomycetota bacterium]
MELSPLPHVLVPNVDWGELLSDTEIAVRLDLFENGTGSPPQWHHYHIRNDTVHAFAQIDEFFWGDKHYPTIVPILFSEPTYLVDGHPITPHDFLTIKLNGRLSGRLGERDRFLPVIDGAVIDHWDGHFIEDTFFAFEERGLNALLQLSDVGPAWVYDGKTRTHIDNEEITDINYVGDNGTGLIQLEGNWFYLQDYEPIKHINNEPIDDVDPKISAFTLGQLAGRIKVDGQWRFYHQGEPLREQNGTPLVGVTKYDRYDRIVFTEDGRSFQLIDRTQHDDSVSIGMPWRRPIDIRDIPDHWQIEPLDNDVNQVLYNATHLKEPRCQVLCIAKQMTHGTFMWPLRVKWLDPAPNQIRQTVLLDMARHYCSHLHEQLTQEKRHSPPDAPDYVVLVEPGTTGDTGGPEL